MGTATIAKNGIANMEPRLRSAKPRPEREMSEAKIGPRKSQRQSSANEQKGIRQTVVVISQHAAKWRVLP